MLVGHYLQVLHLHVGCVVLSGSLFSARALLRISNNPLANHRGLRMLSYVIDTTLLGAAILLTLILHQYPFVNGWLTTKVLLLVLYIVLGTIALKRARSGAARVLAMLAALTVFGYIIGVAVQHHPAGWLRLLQTSSLQP
ncbi:MAG: SirB2 family protein [Proteobacteria bacterium]|nr:SirB2 family protein [Pseudomonadota bacterium]